MRQLEKQKNAQLSEWEFGSKTYWLRLHIADNWAYRHLLFRLVRKDFLLNYQQTILGPLWLLLQPILSLVTYIIVFNELIGVPTGSIPPVLFYASSILLWNFFSDNFTSAAFTFQHNEAIFSKVYFPRLVVPFAIFVSLLLRLLIQLFFLILLLLYYIFFEQFIFNFSGWTLFLPIAIICTGVISLSIGLFFSILTAKYRDLSNVVNLGIRLFMFVTPVIYSVLIVPAKLLPIIRINPLSPLFEAFRSGLFGEGTFTMTQITYSLLFTVIVFVLSIVFFQKMSDHLLDTL